jgi:hypothetical protein
MRKNTPGTLGKSLALVGAVVAVAVVACSDFTGPQAQLSTFSDSMKAFSLNGSPPGAPNAVYFFGEAVVHADANFAFDIAFDVQPNGDVTILPVRTVASGLSSAHKVGVQAVSTLYDSLLVAPKTGFHYDSTIVVRPQTTVVIESQDPSACSVSFTGTNIYAKLVIDSSDPVTRQIRARFTVDPNCGFRSFQKGIPKFSD